MDDDEDISVRPDVPTTNAIVTTSKEAIDLASKIAGKSPPDEMRFSCVMCGWDRTVKFAPDEIEALGGDISNYNGPCPTHDNGCGSMTLVPRNKLMGDDFKSVADRARESRREEVSEASEVFIGKLKEEIGSVMAGSTLSPSPEEQVPEEPPGHGPPRDDLPDVDDVDSADLEPR